MTKFSGMFISGPRDGQQQDATQPIIRIAAEPKIPSSPVWGKAKWGEKQEPIEEAEFIFISLWGFERGFWIPREEADKGLISANSYVIEELMRRYAEKS